MQARKRGTSKARRPAAPRLRPAARPTLTASLMATIILYAVDLEELRGWVGRGDARALAAARRALHEDEEADWEPGETELLNRLLDRVVMGGQLYEGLAPEERYYLTQLLVDLFDEFVDSEAVSDSRPCGRWRRR